MVNISFQSRTDLKAPLSSNLPKLQFYVLGILTFSYVRKMIALPSCDSHNSTRGGILGILVIAVALEPYTRASRQDGSVGEGVS